MGSFHDVLVQFVLPIFGAAIAGAAIGFEREFRGRPAGFRTHILVSLASSLLMLAAVHQMRWLTDTPTEVIRIDPARMAHGILTGIGFLCGGVIFRQGLSVHGLTTAASLWITSALGTLYGIGFYGLAVGGTLATLAVLGLLRLVDHRMPKLTLLDISVRYRRDGGPAEPAFRQMIATLDLKASTMGHRLHPGEDGIEIFATLHGPKAASAESLVERLCAEPRITAFEVTPRND